jgi:hypothetical protein
MQDLDCATVNSPSATDIKDGSACESVQSFENRNTALDWIVSAFCGSGEKFDKM